MMDEKQKKGEIVRGVIMYIARFWVKVFAWIGGFFLLSFLLYWWFGYRACIKDCVNSGMDEEICQVEVCDY